MYTYGTVEHCNDCLVEFDKIITKIRDYLYEKPTSNIHTICEETGVSEKDVFYLLKEGRLVLGRKFEILKCEKCGGVISSGRYCDYCKKEIIKKLNGVAKGMEVPQEEEYRRSSGINMGIVYRREK